MAYGSYHWFTAAIYHCLCMGFLLLIGGFRLQNSLQIKAQNITVYRHDLSVGFELRKRVRTCDDARALCIGEWRRKSICFRIESMGEIIGFEKHTKDTQHKLQRQRHKALTKGLAKMKTLKNFLVECYLDHDCLLFCLLSWMVWHSIHYNNNIYSLCWLYK